MTYDPSFGWQAIFALAALVCAGLAVLIRFTNQFTRLVDSQAALSEALRDLAHKVGEHIQRQTELDELREARLTAVEAALSQWQRYSRQWKGN